MLAIRLPADIESRLEALAKTTGRTKTFYARRAILEYLDDLEDWHLADKVVKDVRSGKEETTPLKDVMREYGLPGD